MPDLFEQTPLELEDFPSHLQQHVEPEAPEKLKRAAAQGMAPAPPDQTVRLLYQLHFDEDDEIRGEAQTALEDMPANVVHGVAEDETHAGVLDWLAERRGDEPDLVEILLRNDDCDDRTIARLARDASPDICEIIATNEVRALETPEIIEQLYQNPNARMATVEQLLELAQRNDVSIEGLPGLQRALDADEAIFEPETSETEAREDSQEGMDREEFDELLRQQAQKAEKEQMKLEEIENNDDLTRSQKEELRDKIEKQTDSRGGMGKTPAELMQMDVSERIRLATIGSRADVKKLVKDANNLVHMAAIESPRIKTSDAIQLAAQKSLPEDVISYIANNQEWTQNYEVVKNLAFNPKTPVQDTMDILKRLRNDDLKKLQDSRDVPHQVSRAAKRLYQKRTGRGGGRGSRGR